MANIPETVVALARSMMALMKAQAADLALPPDELSDIVEGSAPQPNRLPVLDRLPAMPALATASTRPAVEAVLAAAPHLGWRQTYSAEDGFDRRYLDEYGWFDLVAPDGPYRAPGMRLAIGLWGPDLHYPDHAHPPDERYLVLAGHAWFRLRDEPWTRCGPGEVFHVPAGVVHSAEMRDAPLLAASLWRAEDVSVRIDLTDSGRHVAI